MTGQAMKSGAEGGKQNELNPTDQITCPPSHACKIAAVNRLFVGRTAAQAGRSALNQLQTLGKAVYCSNISATSQAVPSTSHSEIVLWYQA
jgi:hypothetical protein